MFSDLGRPWPGRRSGRGHGPGLQSQVGTHGHRGTSILCFQKRTSGSRVNEGDVAHPGSDSKAGNSVGSGGLQLATQGCPPPRWSCAFAKEGAQGPAAGCTSSGSTWLRALSTQGTHVAAPFWQVFQALSPRRPSKTAAGSRPGFVKVAKSSSEQINQDRMHDFPSSKMTQTLCKWGPLGGSGVSVHRRPRASPQGAGIESRVGLPA